jgi:cytochrome b561
MTVVRERSRHTTVTRVLHWLTAALVFTMLMIGFVMVHSLGDYARLVIVHKSLGVIVLVVVLVRIANRFTHRAPALPETVGSIERKLVVTTELSLYALLVVQPLVGWAMVSASGRPVIVFGSVRLPSIAPFGAELFSTLRQTHSLIAFALVLAIAAHISAVLLHSLALRDGMLSRMTFRFRR